MIRYLITDGSGRLEGLDTSVDIIQIRQPGMPARQLAAACRELLARISHTLRSESRLRVSVACESACPTSADEIPSVNSQSHVGQALSHATELNGAMPARTCEQYGLARTKARVLINDRADVAIAAGAHGVHLRSGWVRPGLIRSIAPEGFVVSVACHTVDDVRRAADEGADYAVLAPIFPPRSKVDTRTPLGIEAIREAASLNVTLIALGGITEENAVQCVAAGAAGVAGISLFQR